MLLTVERDRSAPCVEIHLDDEGIDFLIRQLAALRGRRDHSHLFTPSWGGNQLTEDTGSANEVIHKLTIYVWPDTHGKSATAT